MFRHVYLDLVLQLPYHWDCNFSLRSKAETQNIKETTRFISINPENKEHMKVSDGDHGVPSGST